MVCAKAQRHYMGGARNCNSSVFQECCLKAVEWGKMWLGGGEPASKMVPSSCVVPSYSVVGSVCVTGGIWQK